MNLVLQIRKVLGLHVITTHLNCIICGEINFTSIKTDIKLKKNEIQ